MNQLLVSQQFSHSCQMNVASNSIQMDLHFYPQFFFVAATYGNFKSGQTSKQSDQQELNKIVIQSNSNVFTI